MASAVAGSEKAQMTEYLAEVLAEELQISKSHAGSWGRAVLNAIDMDDAIKLMQVYQQQTHLGAEINAKTTHVGYGNYMWTPYVHRFLGDTSLHICIKQKKMKCISILLLMECATDIQNDAGITAEALAVEVLGQSMAHLRRHAIKYLLKGIPPHDFELIPDQFLHRSTEKEAWRLMCQGRLAYAEDHLLPRGGKPKITQFGKRDENDWRIQRNTMDDTIENLRRQVLRRSKIKHDQHLRERGLAAAAANALKNASKEDEKYSSYYRRLNKTPGFRYLKFAARNQKEAASTILGDDDASEINTMASSLSGAGTHFTGGGLANIENVLPHRYITVVSTYTNLKYMRIGPDELKALAGALRTDDLVTELTISSAGVSDAGVLNLCPVIPSMSALMYVDLSHNAITDIGCAAIAKAIEMTASVRRVTLRGNRIGDRGAQQLLDGLSNSLSVRIINLSKNKISEAFKLEISARLERENAERKAKFDEDGFFIDNPSCVDSFNCGDSMSSANSNESSPTRMPPSPSRSQPSVDSWKDELHASLISSLPGSPNRRSTGSRGASRDQIGSRSRSPSRAFRDTFTPMEVLL